MAENEKNISEVETKKEKPAKAKKEKKNGKVGNAWRGFKSELKKIVWPTWKQVLKNSGIVIVIVGICAVAIGVLDVSFRVVFDWFVNLF